MEQFNLTDDQASKIERAAAGEVVDLTDDEAGMLERVMAGGRQESDPQPRQVHTVPDPFSLTGNLPSNATFPEPLPPVPPGGALSQGAPSAMTRPRLEGVDPSKETFKVTPNRGLAIAQTLNPATAPLLDEVMGTKPAYGPGSSAKAVYQSQADYPGTSIAAGIANPINYMTGGLPLANAAMGGLQGANAAAEQGADSRRVGLAGGAGAVLGAAAPAALSAGAKFLGSLAKKVAPGSAEAVNNWLDRYIRQSVIDPDKLAEMEKPGTSAKGFDTAYDDVKDEVLNYVLPKGGVGNLTTAEPTIRASAQTRMQMVSQALDEARAATRIDVPDEELLPQLNQLADDLIARGDLGAVEAAKIIRDEAKALLATRINRAKLPGGGKNPAVPDWERNTNLQELERMKTTIESPDYDPGLQGGDPELGKTLAANELDEGKHFIASKFTGNDPFKTMAADEDASRAWGTTKKALDVVYGVEGQSAQPPGVGLASSGAGLVKRGVGDALKSRASRTIMGTAQSALKWAHGRLSAAAQAQGKPLMPAEIAPFQLESFKRQVEAISMMPAPEQAVAVFSMSSTDPVFSALWKKSQEESDE